MRKNRLGFILGCLLLSPQVLAGHEMEFRISPLGNLVYQLDCMASVARYQCSKDDFNHLWQSEIPVANNDMQMLDRWRSLRTQLDETIEFSQNGDNKAADDSTADLSMVTTPNYPLNAANQLNVLAQTRIMAFAAGSLGAYKQHLELLLSPAHVQAETQVLLYFWPRFEAWFKQQTHLQQFVDDADKLTRELNINQLLSAMRVFYQSDLPIDLVLPVYLIAHPQAKARTSALAFGQNSLIEVLKDEKAAERLAVVIHEIAHYYHESAPLKHHLMMMNHFTDSKSKTGKVGYYLFNEAMASAIGNGILEQRIRDSASFEKYLAYPMSFYNDTGIDQSGKAAMSLVKQQIEKNQPIDQGFLQALDDIWAIALKDLKTSPKELFRHVGIINLTSQNKDLTDQLFDLIQPSSARMKDAEKLDSEEINAESFMLNQFPKLDVLIMANTWDQLAELKLPVLNQGKQDKEGMQILKNDTGTVRVVIVSPSTDYIVNAVTDLLGKTSF